MLTLAEDVLDVLQIKAFNGCYRHEHKWDGFQNGNGTNIGRDIDRLIRKAKREIKKPSFQDLIDRNYATVERRGQMSDSSDKLISKIEDEVKELRESRCNGPHVEFDPSEAIDVILSSCTLLLKYGYDIPKLMEQKVKFNEQRED